MKKKILICDDDGDILELFTHILSAQYQVTAVQKIKDMVELVAQTNPDIILMDIWIPVIGGEEAVLSLKANDTTRHIPVLLVSANDEIEKVFFRTNADGFLRKPFSVKECKAKIAAFLNQNNVPA